MESLAVHQNERQRPRIANFVNALEANPRPLSGDGIIADGAVFYHRFLHEILGRKIQSRNRDGIHQKVPRLNADERRQTDAIAHRRQITDFSALHRQIFQTATAVMAMTTAPMTCGMVTVMLPSLTIAVAETSTPPIVTVAVAPAIL